MGSSWIKFILRGFLCKYFEKNIFERKIAGFFEFLLSRQFVVIMV